jgi:CHAD domain-containing protein
MRRVLKALRRVQKSADPESVHRLRVSLRRCRSLAGLMEEVDLHPSWAHMRRASRKLFRALGELRDAQILEEGVKKVSPANDSLRDTLLKVFERREVKPLARARRAVEQFDQRAWTRLARTLQKRARFVPPNSLVAECLALERYQELWRLHVRAVRTQQPKPWHELRIAVKRFRYTIESVLPARAADWDGGLQDMQDVLGEIHDLDILMKVVRSGSASADAHSVGAVRQRIRARRQACIDQYRRRTQGRAGLLNEWNAGLPHDARIEEAARARLRATARAMDRHPRRTALVSQLALQIFDALVAARATGFRDEKTRRILQAASLLHAIGSGDRHGSRQKAARDIVRALPAPPGWARDDWELLALVVRYHRGAEPRNAHRSFFRLPKKRQEVVRLLAGVLRLARALRRSGVRARPRLRTDTTATGVRLRVAGVVDTQRLAAAKHLLDRDLRRPLFIESIRHPGSSATRRSAIRRPGR